MDRHPAWCRLAWNRVQALPSLDARLIRGSLWMRSDHRGVCFGYGEVDRIRSRGPFDLVFIDAPAKVFGREGALHAAMGSLPSGGWIVLDDTARPRERRTLRRRLLCYPELELVADDETVPPGMAVPRRAPGPLWSPPVGERLRELRLRPLRELYRDHATVRDHLRCADTIRHAH